jgi:hypothetical protein
MDLLTTTVDDEKLRHQAESGNDGSRPFDTSNVSQQKGNVRDDDDEGILSVSRGLSVPTDAHSNSTVTCFSTPNATTAQPRTAALLDRSTSHPSEPEPEPNTLAMLNTITDQTPSLNQTTTANSHADSDWRRWLLPFQNIDTAPSPDLERAEEDWYFNPLLDPYAPESIDVPLDSLYSSSGLSATGDSRLYAGHFYDRGYQYYSAGLLGNGGSYSEMDLPLTETSLLRANKGKGRIRRKIAIFFSKLKAYVEALFCRQKW